ncbi:hypothetical protein [Aneurinibacillus aneurinilyticus]|nr:hypothetical protein [Aneurinibacillus aneurinilyticus]MED0704783.1 hypothetical protein [Aneurinibacillus aneurinilyticus]MED0722614.1 hypothetical protein [Aneurinibacillus aneurinilyticus]MED0730863.1 hypothetical protein [Aneurinibacillus aneurinilyticus]MED0740484.1 hypothetical protein [Aneurinibacillus aneurinilyticus]
MRSGFKKWFGQQKRREEQMKEQAESFIRNEEEPPSESVEKKQSGTVVYKKRLPNVPGRKKARKKPVHVIDKELFTLLDSRNDLAGESDCFPEDYSSKAPLRPYQIQLYNILMKRDGLLIAD